MDYTRQPLLFKLRKVARYVQLYGPQRTYVKVLGQLHMKKQFEQLPASSHELKAGQTIGLLGCGNYAYSNIAYYLNKEFGGVIGACMDRNAERAASLAQRYNVPFHTTDADAVIEHPGIEMLYIASNHASHAPYAVRALNAGKHVYIEKPHVVNEEQLAALDEAARSSAGMLFLGFNRPGSDFGRAILDALGRESGSGMYNWFVAGHAIDPDHWYFKPEEGGRVLGNLCHWTDFVLRMAGPDAFPVRITPTRGQRSDMDIVVTYTFPDETIAVISFSAKGHTFEGVREVLNAHRGNCLISMHDYKTLTIEVGEQKRRSASLYRDHGHRRNIVNALKSVRGERPYDHEAALRHALDSAWLFLKTREALETSTAITVERYESAVAHR